MAERGYRPVTHDHDAFLDRALRRKGFSAAYGDLAADYELVRQLLHARIEAGLTQEEVARRMGTTKSAICRLEGVGKHSPSVSTLQRYARALGCQVELRLVPTAALGSERLPGVQIDIGGRRIASR